MVKNVLHKKLLRDMYLSGMQFIALISLCVLGTFVYSGIEGIARMAGATNEKYFEENRLAHFWVTLPGADRQALASIRATDGVETATARFSLDMETTLPGEPTLNVTAYDGEIDVNVPIIWEGEGLSPGDKRGCLMQRGFAEAHGLSVGDAVTVRLDGRETTFFIRGISYSPEFISVANGVAAKPEEYGYILVNARAFPHIPLNQIVVRLEGGTELSAAREAIAKTLPDAFIIDRTAHRSTAAAQDNVTMFASLSLVFPLAAFIVAALIVMTTLTRMIDNQRMQMGMLRAMGFSSRTIKRHYLSYAIWPSLIGSVLGAIIGHISIPPLIWVLLIGQNEYPYRLSPPISLITWILAGVSVAMSVTICYMTYRRASRETAADLLRPKVPKAGKRNILERVKPIWSRLSFNSKMVVRNLSRSKMRTMMSCVGLLCCNVLIISSMGLQDSVLTTAQRHYGLSLAYDLRAELSDKAGDAQAYASRLPAEAVECVMELSADISFRGRNRTALVTVIEDGQRLLKLGPNESLVSIERGSAALTEKMADTLSISVGDSLVFQLPGDSDTFSLPVSRLVINNFNQGVYMTRSTFEGIRKGAFIPTAIQLSKPTDACVALLDGMEEVERIDYIKQQQKDAIVALDLVSSVFVLLMLIALALAFVICYNMGLINFAERTREYATLKVLGYHQREIRRLILSENTLVTLIALVVSVVPGILFTGVILAMCETDSVRYITFVSVKSILLSCAITYLFSMLIQRLLVLKVRSIVMVEALKSVE